MLLFVTVSVLRKSLLLEEISLIKTILMNLKKMKNDVLNLYEKYKLAYDKDITVFGNDFYNSNIWRFFQKNLMMPTLWLILMEALKIVKEE